MFVGSCGHEQSQSSPTDGKRVVEGAMVLPTQLLFLLLLCDETGSLFSSLLWSPLELERDAFLGPLSHFCSEVTIRSLMPIITRYQMWYTSYPLGTHLKWLYTYQRKLIFWKSKIYSLFQSSMHLPLIPMWTFFLQEVFNYYHARFPPSLFILLFLLSLPCGFRFRVRFIVGVSCDSSIDFTKAVSSCEFESFLLLKWLEVEMKRARCPWLYTFIVWKDEHKKKFSSHKNAAKL